jgi:hypothetical protein
MAVAYERTIPPLTREHIAEVAGCRMVDGSCTRHTTPWAPRREGCAYLDQLIRDAAADARRNR